jgi:hypothetical protein
MPLDHLFNIRTAALSNLRAYKLLRIKERKSGRLLNFALSLKRYRDR